MSRTSGSARRDRAPLDDKLRVQRVAAWLGTRLRMPTARNASGRVETAYDADMPLPQQLLDILRRIDKATSDSATRIKALQKQIADLKASGSISADDANTLTATLTSEAATLEGIAADPNDPVPTPTAPIAA